MTRHQRLAALLLCILPALAAAPASAQPLLTVDILEQDAAAGDMLRVYGAEGEGNFGLPVAGGYDFDGDGFNDYAVGHMTASPNGRARSGLVNVIFGDGTAGGSLDTATPSERVYRIGGAQVFETCGSEVWMADVTGDGLGDLLVCRQNHTPDDGLEGIGALTILIGGPYWRAQADALATLDLASPPADAPILTFAGPARGDRLGIWIRTGDVDGDSLADIVVAADQSDIVAPDGGSVYVIRGGAHLETDKPEEIDLADFGSTSLAGNIARILPPPFSTEFHLGATTNVFDLDGNGRAEIVTAAALSRAGATLQPPGSNTSHGNGGTVDGTVWIVWDDNFPAAPWPAGLQFALDAAPGAITRIDGDSAIHRLFGEEIVGGVDFDGDGSADLFIGDLLGDAAGGRPTSGTGVVFFRASDLKGLDFDLDLPAPPGVAMSTILGPMTGAIAADTAVAADFDGDGLGDLAIGNPHDDPLGRNSAGTIHILYGRQGAWPALIDLAPGAVPAPEDLRVALIIGARGNDFSTGEFDTGDTLCYSAAAGDIDGDGRADLITNEMVGNGTAPDALDVGNLIIFSGASLLAPPAPAAVEGWQLYE